MSLRNSVETVLFAAGKSMPLGEVAELIEEKEAKTKKILEELKEEYSKAAHALAISEGVRGWKMVVKESYLPLARKLVTDTELETPVLETLAVIAWKRPILQSEVVKIRGDHSYQHIKELMDIGFISREPHGRSYKLKLEEKFFDYFDVEGDKGIRELFSKVEKPEPKPKVGKLEVVDIEKDKQEKLSEDLSKGKLGSLEVQDIDPYEKRKIAVEELDELDRELEAISKRTDKHVEELEVYKKVEEDDDSEENKEKELIDSD